ncbi:alpha/beta hydrolase family protein [Microlunatus parietis]|uniref:Dienelactone hydrolase n=1 Tax=Microlunatus parietis TaxID=682979 RepID=A0A7Y9I560_9ACTN|nr:acetylxylan esterase [Microlunatus parietis]NYE70479.1 dienelactone hydrolase [Microlunatus parietis]
MITDPLAASLRGLGGYLDAGAQWRDHVFRRTESELRRWHAVNDRLATSADVAARQRDIRAAAAELLGAPVPADPPPARSSGVVRMPSYRIEKLIIEAGPGHGITANLYRPDDLDGPASAVLILCGHAAESKAYPQYQAVAARLARNGLVALVIDPFGQGERRQFPDRPELAQPTADHLRSGVACWWAGRSSGRYFVRDAVRAVDYLAAHPEVDPARIGVTGNSGGGTQTALLMMIDDRIAAAAPATFLTSRGHYLRTGQAQDAEQVIIGGTAAGLDHEDVLIAMAPRPVLVLAADYDFFPIEGTVASVQRAGRAYRILGAADRLRLHRTRGGHAYHPELARAACAFFVDHLGGDRERPLDEAEPEPLAPAELACTRTGQLITDGEFTATIEDLNRAETAERVPDREAWLLEQVEHGRDPAADPYPRWFPATDHDLGGTAARVRPVYWWSERDLVNAALLITPADRPYRSLTLVLLPDGTAEADRHRDRFATMIAEDRAIFVLDVRGVGALAPHPIGARFPDPESGTRYRLTCDLLWLGDSPIAGQVYDVRRCLELIASDPELDHGDRPLDLWGVGSASMISALVAQLDPSRFRTVTQNGLVAATDPAEWRTVLPGFATVFDLPWLSGPTTKENP